MESDKPIGVFDSGIGGLTVLREIKVHLPKENIVYFGDTARVPYGIKSAETVTRFSHEIADYLVRAGVKMLVVACNTASSAALTSLRAKLDIPVVGVLMPGAYAATRATKTGKIGIIGTEGTINSGSYARLVKNIRPGTEVIGQACPLFVPLVEEGRLAGEVTTLVASEYLAPMKAHGVDTLVLGCTHYPLLKGVIGSIMGPGVKLIDSAHETALEVERVLGKSGMMNSSDDEASVRCFVTDAPERFKAVGEQFLEFNIPVVEKVQL
jgi:glutamate racemase